MLIALHCAAEWYFLCYFNFHKVLYSCCLILAIGTAFFTAVHPNVIQLKQHRQRWMCWADVDPCNLVSLSGLIPSETAGQGFSSSAQSRSGVSVNTRTHTHTHTQAHTHFPPSPFCIGIVGLLTVRCHSVAVDAGNIRSSVVSDVRF